MAYYPYALHYETKGNEKRKLVEMRAPELLPRPPGPPMQIPRTLLFPGVNSIVGTPSPMSQNMWPQPRGVPMPPTYPPPVPLVVSDEFYDAAASSSAYSPSTQHNEDDDDEEYDQDQDELSHAMHHVSLSGGGRGRPAKTKLSAQPRKAKGKRKSKEAARVLANTGGQDGFAQAEEAEAETKAVALYPRQREVAACVRDGPVLLFAMTGSGKTLTMIHGLGELALARAPFSGVTFVLLLAPKAVLESHAREPAKLDLFSVQSPLRGLAVITRIYNAQTHKTLADEMAHLEMARRVPASRDRPPLLFVVLTNTERLYSDMTRLFHPHVTLQSPVFLGQTRVDLPDASASSPDAQAPPAFHVQQSVVYGVEGGWDAVVLDEADKLRNPDTVGFAAYRLIPRSGPGATDCFVPLPKIPLANLPVPEFHRLQAGVAACNRKPKMPTSIQVWARGRKCRAPVPMDGESWSQMEHRVLRETYPKAHQSQLAMLKGAVARSYAMTATPLNNRIEDMTIYIEMVGPDEIRDSALIPSEAEQLAPRMKQVFSGLDSDEKDGKDSANKKTGRKKTKTAMLRFLHPTPEDLAEHGGKTAWARQWEQSMPVPPIPTRTWVLSSRLSTAELRVLTRLVEVAVRDIVDSSEKATAASLAAIASGSKEEEEREKTEEKWVEALVAEQEAAAGGLVMVWLTLLRRATVSVATLQGQAFSSENVNVWRSRPDAQLLPFRPDQMRDLYNEMRASYYSVLKSPLGVGSRIASVVDAVRTQQLPNASGRVLWFYNNVSALMLAAMHIFEVCNVQHATQPPNCPFVDIGMLTGTETSAAQSSGEDSANQRLFDWFRAPVPKNVLRILFLQTRCGGTGLNLQEADTAIFGDMDWNPAQMLQASGRIVRLTQKFVANIVLCKSDMPMDMLLSAVNLRKIGTGELVTRTEYTRVKTGLQDMQLVSKAAALSNKDEKGVGVPEHKEEKKTVLTAFEELRGALQHARDLRDRTIAHFKKNGRQLRSLPAFSGIKLVAAQNPATLSTRQLATFFEAIPGHPSQQPQRKEEEDEDGSVYEQQLMQQQANLRWQRPQWLWADSYPLHQHQQMSVLIQ